MIDVNPVVTRRDREAFLRFPWRVYRDLPQWVPPILSSQRKEIGPERGFFFTDGFGSKAEFFLARDRARSSVCKRRPKTGTVKGSGENR